MLDRRLGVVKFEDGFSHLPVVAFKRVHRLFQPQDGAECVADFAKGVFDTEHLIPLLKQVRQFALGQLETLVGRGQFDFLAIALRVHPTRNLEGTEHGEQAANMLFL